MRLGALETASETAGGTRIGPFTILCRDELGSRYQLDALIGAGGMAEVFRGTMRGIEGFARQVAIKRVRGAMSNDAAFRAMFIREAQIASQLAHPNIVSVLDFRRDADARLVLVMEYVDGVDLASLLASGPVAPPLAIFLAVEMLRGLGYAHARSAPVVHRDVSPQNLLLGYEGAVKLSDFGLAQVRRAAGDDAAAGTEAVRGTPGYMAPEQLERNPVDGRADLYAAGVMLWEMLAQRPLFTGTPREIMSQAMFRDVPRPSACRRGVPADVEAVAMTLISRDREQRYARAHDAITALLACREVSRDGRGELVALLGDRFPRTASARHRRVVASAVLAAPVTRTARSQALPPAPALALARAPGGLVRGVRPIGLVAAVAVVGLAALAARGSVARAPRFVPPPVHKASIWIVPPPSSACGDHHVPGVEL